MKVLIRGPLLSVTGYGSHTRQIWKWARSKKNWDVYASVVPWGTCTYYIDPNAEDGTIGDIMSRTLPLDMKADMSLQVQLPDEWDTNLAHKNIGITAGIEGDRCNSTWIDAARNMDRVIVPSEYSKLAFLNGGLDPSHIMNVPEAITCGDLVTKEVIELREKLDGLSTDFNFLVFGQITNPQADNDRKNTLNCIKWLCEVFKNNKNVGIVLKTNMGRMTCQDRQVTINNINAVIHNVREGMYPRIHIMHGLMDKEEIGEIFRHPKMKALLAPTRGEGWGLPILDAAASGLPVIATGCTGHVDFMKHVKYLDIKYTYRDVPEQNIDGRIWVPGCRWVEPSPDHFKSRVKKFFKGSDLPRQWAADGKEKVRELFHIESVMKKYDKALGDLIDCS